MKFTLVVLTLLFQLFASASMNAQDLRYKPVNPAFGGESYNYTWLLNQAQVQNDYAADPNSDLFNRDPLLDFQNDLNRQVLSQLSRELVGDLFGENGNLNEGIFEIGDYQIEIIHTAGGINIDILDILTGSTTNVTIPTY